MRMVTTWPGVKDATKRNKREVLILLAIQLLDNLI